MAAGVPPSAMVINRASRERAGIIGLANRGQSWAGQIAQQCKGRSALIGSGCRYGALIDHSSFLSEGPYRSSRPETDHCVFLHELAIGHPAAGKRHHHGMLPLAVVLSDLDDLLPRRWNVPFDRANSLLYVR
jgi:hypothetical protein